MGIDIAARQHRAIVAAVGDLPVGSMRMVRVGDRRVVLVHTSSGFHALDNACPHEGYGLVQGALDGELLTCEWHNWKFDVSDGSCVLGEEAVAAHEVIIEDDNVIVVVTEPDPDEVRAAAAESLDRGIDANYGGQIARDSLRLLRAGATPTEIVWRAVERTIGRTEYGWNHSLAMTTDCLTAAAALDGDARLTPVAQAVAALAESELRRPPRPRPAPEASPPGGLERFRALIEAERADEADAMLTGALLDGLDRTEAVRWMLAPVCDHHLAFGHGAIYVQKAFEMLDIVGWGHAPDLLAHVALMQVISTREDRLPYMRPFIRALDAARLDERLAIDVDPSWSGRDQLVDAFLGADAVDALHAALGALDAGAGVHAVIDAVALAASERMLGHDLAHEQRPGLSGYGWLDITHSLTYADAARWAWDADPCADTARLAMYTVFHVVDGGRETSAHGAAARVARPDRSAASRPLDDALAAGDVDAAVAGALHGDADDVAAALVRASLDDRSGALIVVAHHIKTVRAAIVESQRTGSNAPLAAAARFVAAPARQRFIANGVARARHFIATGNPPPR